MWFHRDPTNSFSSVIWEMFMATLTSKLFIVTFIYLVYEINYDFIDFFN